MSETYHLSEMQGMRRHRAVVLLTALLVAFGVGACDRSQSGEGTTAATPSSEATEPRSSRPSRSEVACHLHSCAPPKYCNRDTGICELLPCADSRDCPYGYKCDHSRQVCE